jgi:Transposase
MIFVGDDWAEDHHDTHVMDQAGLRLASRRLPEGLSGIGQLHALIAEHAEEPDQVVVGIETDRGLWVSALIATGYQVFAVNPLAVARYRDRHHISGAKSDVGDAKLLADLVRTDRHNHRSIAGDSATAEAIKDALRQDRRAPYNRQSDDGYRHADRRTPQRHLPRPPSRAGDGMTGPLRVGAIGANPNRSWAKDSHIPALRVAART